MTSLRRSLEIGIHLRFVYSIYFYADGEKSGEQSSMTHKNEEASFHTTPLASGSRFTMTKTGWLFASFRLSLQAHYLLKMEAKQISVQLPRTGQNGV